MLISEVLLLEYDRQRAIQALGDSLWLAVLRENTGLWDYDRAKFAEFALNNKNSKGEYIKNALNNPEQQRRMSDVTMRSIEDVDPTNNKQYTQWMARMYINGSERHIEDVESTLATYVDKFHKLKIKNKLPPNERDINRYRTATELYTVMDRYEDPEQDAKGRANKVYEDADVTVVVPLDQDAACNYGRQTRWCTAATKGHNAFEEYNRQGPLYILIPKTPRYDREKYQIHFESGQYMNEVDDPVGLPFLLQNRFPGLYEFFKNNEKTAALMQDMVVFTPDNVLEKLTDQIWELIHDRVSDIISDWEANDDSYYSWLRDEGYVDEEGDVDWNNAPAYTEYNDDARRWIMDIEEFAHLSPSKLKRIVTDLFENGSVDDDTVYNLETFIAQNIREEMRRDSYGADAIADWIDRHIRIIKTDQGPKVTTIKSK